MDPLPLAAAYVKAALKGRKVGFKTDGTSMRWQSVYYNRFYRNAISLVAVVHMGLAFFEPSRMIGHSPTDLDTWDTKPVELVILLVYLADIAIRLRFQGLARYLQSWGRLELLATCAFAVDLALPFGHFTRILRPFFLVTKRKHIRYIFTGIAHSFAPQIPVLILLLFAVGAFALVSTMALSTTVPAFATLSDHETASPPYCSVFSKGSCEDFYSSFGPAYYHLFVLAAKANWPVAMLPLYKRVEATGIFFVAFMLVVHFFLWRLLLAVSFSSFASKSSAQYQSQQRRSRAAFRAAFALLADEHGFMSEASFTALAARVAPGMTSVINKIIFTAVGGRLGAIDAQAFVAACSMLNAKATRIRYADSVHSRLDKVRVAIGRFLASWSVPLDVLVIIMAVTELAVTSVGSFGSVQERQTVQLAVSLTILAIFAAEMVLRVFSAGLRRYLGNGYNLADMAVLAASIASFVFLPSDPASTDTRLRILLFLRLARGLRLLRRLLPPVEVVLRTVAEITPLLWRIGIVLGISIYVLAVIGGEAFAGVLDPSNPAVVSSSYGMNGQWSLNFDSFPKSCMVIFAILITTQSPIVVEGLMAGTGSWWPGIFFFASYYITVCVVSNILIALLLQSYGISSTNQRHRLDGFVEIWEALLARAQADLHLQDPATFPAPLMFKFRKRHAFLSVNEVLYGEGLSLDFELDEAEAAALLMMQGGLGPAAGPAALGYDAQQQGGAATAAAAALSSSTAAPPSAAAAAAAAAEVQSEIMTQYFLPGNMGHAGPKSGGTGLGASATFNGEGLASAAPVSSVHSLTASIKDSFMLLCCCCLRPKSSRRRAAELRRGISGTWFAWDWAKRLISLCKRAAQSDVSVAVMAAYTNGGTPGSSGAGVGFGAAPGGDMSGGSLGMHSLRVRSAYNPAVWMAAAAAAAAAEAAGQEDGTTCCHADAAGADGAGASGADSGTAAALAIRRALTDFVRSGLLPPPNWDFFLDGPWRTAWRPDGRAPVKSVDPAATAAVPAGMGSGSSPFHGSSREPSREAGREEDGIDLPCPSREASSVSTSLVLPSAASGAAAATPVRAAAVASDLGREGSSLDMPSAPAAAASASASTVGGVHTPAEPARPAAGTAVTPLDLPPSGSAQTAAQPASAPSTARVRVSSSTSTATGLHASVASGALDATANSSMLQPATGTGIGTAHAVSRAERLRRIAALAGRLMAEQEALREDEKRAAAQALAAAAQRLHEEQKAAAEAEAAVSASDAAAAAAQAASAGAATPSAAAAGTAASSSRPPRTGGRGALASVRFAASAIASIFRNRSAHGGPASEEADESGHTLLAAGAEDTNGEWEAGGRGAPAVMAANAPLLPRAVSVSLQRSSPLAIPAGGAGGGGSISRRTHLGVAEAASVGIRPMSLAFPASPAIGLETSMSAFGCSLPREQQLLHARLPSGGGAAVPVELGLGLAAAPPPTPAFATSLLPPGSLAAALAASGSAGGGAAPPSTPIALHGAARRQHSRELVGPEVSLAGHAMLSSTPSAGGLHPAAAAAVAASAGVAVGTLEPSLSRRSFALGASRAGPGLGAGAARQREATVVLEPGFTFLADSDDD